MAVGPALPGRRHRPALLVVFACATFVNIIPALALQPRPTPTELGVIGVLHLAVRDQNCSRSRRGGAAARGRTRILPRDSFANPKSNPKPNPKRPRSRTESRNATETLRIWILEFGILEPWPKMRHARLPRWNNRDAVPVIRVCAVPSLHFLEIPRDRGSRARLRAHFELSRHTACSRAATEDRAMSLVRLLGFRTLACGCVIGRYRELATSRELTYIEEKGAGLRDVRPSPQSYDCRDRARASEQLSPSARPNEDVNFQLPTSRRIWMVGGCGVRAVARTITAR